MQIQPVVIGTAGHIDHGKSSLVRALTGVDPDRLKEERERGMTIDLGFAPLELPDGRVVGIVDVPGHERFIRNMVAGATGIDLVVLVVAADDGVMPQTREHLQIMELLGVERGLIALNKIDAVDRSLVDLAAEDVRENVRGTFLEDAPLLEVSATTGAGVPALREVLCALAAATPPRSSEGIFRMPIQRVFSKPGFGTIVTGIPVSGEAAIGDTLEVLPGKRRGKVRSLNAYKHAVERVRSGHSSALNLSDLDQHAVARGFVVAAPGFFEPQTMVAARLYALADLEAPLANRLQVRLHTGTADAPGEVVLLDRERIEPGESGLVQFRLREPVVCAPGDRFVVRLLSPVVTLGGGTLLEETRHRMKRFKGFVIEGLTQREHSLASAEDLLDATLARRRAELVSVDDVVRELKRPRAETVSLLESLREKGRVVTPRPERWVHAEVLERACATLDGALAAWFAEHAHRAVVDVLELRRRTGFEAGFLAAVLDHRERAGGLELLPGGRVRPVGRAAELSPALRRLADAVGERLAGARFQPPSLKELAEAGTGTPKDLERVAEHLVDDGAVAHVGGGLYVATAALAEARAAIVENCQAHGHLEIPELRDRLGTTRKFLIPLLEYFDAQGVTIRQGANRVLRK